MEQLTAKQLAELKRERAEGANKIAQALHLLRARQSDLVAATKLQPSHISEIINGKYSRLSLDTARRISTALGACIEDIFPPPCAARKKAA